MPAPSQEVSDVTLGQAALLQKRAQELMRRRVRHRIEALFIGFDEGSTQLGKLAPPA
jgi:hypothetical protein